MLKGWHMLCLCSHLWCVIARVSAQDREKAVRAVRTAYEPQAG